MCLSDDPALLVGSLVGLGLVLGPGDLPLPFKVVSLHSTLSFLGLGVVSIPLDVGDNGGIADISKCLSVGKVDV